MTKDGDLSTGKKISRSAATDAGYLVVIDLFIAAPCFRDCPSKTGQYQYNLSDTKTASASSVEITSESLLPFPNIQGKSPSCISRVNQSEFQKSILAFESKTENHPPISVCDELDCASTLGAEVSWRSRSADTSKNAQTSAPG